MIFTDQELMRLCALDADGLAGFRAQMQASRSRAVLPEELKGTPREDRYSYGVRLARAYLRHRQIYSTQSKGQDRKDEQLRDLAYIASLYRKG